MMMMMNGDSDGDGHGDGDGGDNDDDDDGGKGSAKGKEERTSILIHSLTPDHPPLAAITSKNNQSDGVAPGTDYEILVRGCWDSAQQKSSFFFFLSSSCGLSADVL